MEQNKGSGAIWETSPDVDWSCLALESYNLDDSLTMNDTNMEPRLSMKSQNLFSERKGHDSETVAEAGGAAARSSPLCTSEHDDLNKTCYAWELLQELELLSDGTAMAPPEPLSSTGSCDGECALGQLDEALDFVLDAFRPFEELLSLSPDDHSNGCSDLPMMDSNPLEDLSPKDILADLISNTILVDPSLAGVLSDTTLDFSTVFGETTTSSDNCSTIDQDALKSNGFKSVDSPAADLQQVPEVSPPTPPKSSNRKRPLKRRLSPTAPSGPSTSTADEAPKSPPNMLTIEDNESIPEETKKHKSSQEELKYTVMRQKNNLASKRSRQSRKQRRTDLDLEVVRLEAENKKLHETAEQLEKTVNALKTSLLTHIKGLSIK